MFLLTIKGMVQLMINGNLVGTFQKFKTQKNSIGESVREWFDIVDKNGFLDYVTGDADYEMNAKIQQSTHIFICDWFDCAILEITSENARLLINNQVYQILLIDDPMGMHQHLEIYLKFVGGQTITE